MESKKINQLATNVAPVSTDLTIIGDPITGVSKKITLLQLASIFSGSIAFYTNYAAFPASGTVNTIYCAKDTQKLYLWSGSAYTEVFPSQALLDTYQLRSEKGVSNGYASLDSAGKVPITQLPSSIMEYKGMWSATTNTPTLANGTGDTGDVYICNGAGSVNFGAGAITFAVGDYVVYSGTIWQRSSGAVGTVTSVGLSTNGNSITIGSSPISTSGTITANFAGTSLQYINGAGNLTTFPTLTGYVTSVTGTAPVVSSGGTTPAISMAAATTSVNGYLTSADFTTFNNKQNAITLTTTGTSGASTLIGATLNIPNYGSALTGYVPYTGATGDVDLGAFKLNAQSLHAKGTAGNGHLGLKHQSASATASANEASLFADSLGDLSWLNGNLYLSKFITSGNTAARSYTFPNANGTIALLSSLSATSPIFYNSTTGVISSQAASDTLEGYITIGTQSFAGAKTFTQSIIINGTGTNDAYTILQSAGTSKWRIGNNYNAGANSFDIYNPVTSTTPLSISSTGAITLTANVTTTGAQFVQNGLFITYVNAGALAGNTNIWGRTNGLNFALGNLTGGAGFIFQTATSYDYTFPAATGTIALTSQLTSGTVTSVAALTLGTTGTDLSSTVANGTTTPVITLNVPTASATNRGALSSADWTTFNNKQAALTNPVTGTGTTNYHTKFTGTSTIGNSLIWDNGTNVGIGNTNTSYTLDVSGTFRTTGNAILGGTTTFGSDIFTYNNGGIFFSGGGTYTSGILQNASGLALQSGTAVRMTITSAGNVGIGTSSPSYKLHVSNNTNGFITRFTGGTSSDVNIGIFGSTAGAFGSIGTESNHPFNIFTNGTDRMTITSGGDVTIGIATAATNVQLNINGYVNKAGRIQFQESGVSKWLVGNGAASENGRFEIYDNTNGTGVQLLRGATSWTALSDERFKDIIEPISVNNKLKNVRAVIGKYKTDNEGVRRNFLIAQDLLKVFPEVVDVDEDETKPMGVRYQDLIPVLVKAIQEQQIQIQNLQEQINILAK